MDQKWLSRLCIEHGGFSDVVKDQGITRYEFVPFTVEMVDNKLEAKTTIIGSNTGSILFSTDWYDYTDDQSEEIRALFRTRL